MGKVVATRRRLGEWDVCVGYIPDRGTYWWNAWRERDSRELSGDTETEVEAWQEARKAMDKAVVYPALRLVP